MSVERKRVTPASSVTGRTSSDTVDESDEEEEELTNSEEKDAVAVAVPHLEPHRAGMGEYETVMRCRSPGYRDESDEEDGAPNSLSLSVSEVQTSVFRETRLGNLTRLDHDKSERGRLMCQAKGNKMVTKQPYVVKEEEDRIGSGRKGPCREVDRAIKPIGKSMIRSSKRIPPRPVLKLVVTKPEVKEEHARGTPPPKEDVDTVFTRERRGAPRSPLFSSRNVERDETTITQSSQASDESTEEDQEADYGVSGGEDMRMLSRPKRTSVIYMRKPKLPLITGKNMEDRGRQRGEKKRRLVRTRDKNSPEQRKRKRTEIQKDIDRRNEMANKRQRSIEGLSRRKPFYEIKTREVSTKELQAENAR